GSSPPRIVSIRGAAMGSKEESTSSTTWLPASSEPPNWASFRANRGMKAIRSIATSRRITIYLFFISFCLLQKSHSPQLRLCVCFQSHDDHTGQQTLYHCQRQLGGSKYQKEPADGRGQGGVRMLSQSQLNG